ncbi:AraC family transcriptional regulator [Acidisoma sp. 7E03]
MPPRPTPPARFATIRASVPAMLLRVLPEEDARLDRLLHGRGLSRAQLQDPYECVPIARYIGLLEDAAEALGRPLLGCEIGLAMKPNDIGALGILFTTSGSIAAAFRRMAAFLVSLQGSTISGLVEEEDTVSWVYQLSDARLWPRRQDTELTFAASCQLVRLGFRPRWAPRAVHFEHADAGQGAALEKIFRAPIFFGQPSNRLVMDRTEAEHLHRHEDAGLIAVLERHLQDLMPERETPEETLREQVRSAVAILLGHQPVTLPRIAAELGLSPRTLQRRLAAGGTSLQALVREQRQRIALHHLESGRLPCAQIAEALGYADSTVFWRAMKGWTGQAPTALARGGAVP